LLAETGLHWKSVPAKQVLTKENLPRQLFTLKSFSCLQVVDHCYTSARFLEFRRLTLLFHLQKLIPSDIFEPAGKCAWQQLSGPLLKRTAFLTHRQQPARMKKKSDKK
jgi:hypothetical protein